MSTLKRAAKKVKLLENLENKLRKLNSTKMLHANKIKFNGARKLMK
jgi:hypothetical protein